MNKILKEFAYQMDIIYCLNRNSEHIPRLDEVSPWRDGVSERISKLN